MEIVNRIKLLMEYDMKHTLSENVEIISEIQIPGIGNIARNYIDDIFKSGKKFKTVIGTEIKSADELINSLKSMGDDALNSVGKTHIQQTLIKNPALQLSSKQKLINNMVSNPNVIKKYSKDSYDIILQKFKNAGYPDDVAETIAKKLKPKTATPKPNTVGKALSETDSIMDNILNNVDNLNVINSKEYFKDFLSKGVKDGSIKLGRVSIDDAAEDLIRTLNPKGLNDKFIKQFQNKTLSQQRLIARKIINDLERSIPENIKKQPWFSRVNQGLKTFEGGSTLNIVKFAKSVINYYLAVGIGTFLVLLNSEQTVNFDLIKKSLFWPRTFIDKLIEPTQSGTTSGTTSGGSYTDTLESFKQFLRDKNNRNADSATYDSTTGIYYVNGVDYEFDSVTKTFK
jgi:hypothetical protein